MLTSRTTFIAGATSTMASTMFSYLLSHRTSKYNEVAEKVEEVDLKIRLYF